MSPVQTSKRKGRKDVRGHAIQSPTKNTILPKRRFTSRKQTSRSQRRVISLDTETTGLDLQHGCKPFFVVTCDQTGYIRYWEWKVDPFTREPIVPQEDIEEIEEYLDEVDKIIFHHAKFDIHALRTVGITFKHWDKVEDTLIAAHISDSKSSHKLKDLCIERLDILDDDQAELKAIVNKARNYGRRHSWRVAKAQDPHWPAMKQVGKSRSDADAFSGCDYWMPMAVADAENYPEDHPYRQVLRRYAFTDAQRTIELWQSYEEILCSDNYGHLYRERIRSIRTLFDMENCGITLRRFPSVKLQSSYRHRAVAIQAKLLKESGGTFENPNSTQQVQDYLFSRLGCPETKSTKSGNSTRSEELRPILDQLGATQKHGKWLLADLGLSPKEIKLRDTLCDLIDWRQVSKASEYINSYLLGCENLGRGYIRIRPNFNATGTDTTRLSSNNPNAQNISKKEGFNIRQLFAPTPGRRWYSADYSNIEMRIFAYASGDKSLITAFETGNSVHNIFCEILHPTLWAECLASNEQFKVKYEATWYQWVKNGNFSLIYGASEKKANATYHVDGAYKTIRSSLPTIDAFMEEKFQEAKRYGRIHTLTGYPLGVSTEEPHKAVNYFVQGTAGWAMVLAMNRCHEYLKDYPGYNITMTIHDELVFDFPDEPAADKVMYGCWQIMEAVGKDIGFPLPVEVNRVKGDWAHEEKWSYGQAA